jgi:predicted DNA-binding protein (MmcQ/YjbR family)
MNIEELREYCISKPCVKEEFPFDEITLVFKVGGRIFALTNLDGYLNLNLKCDPEKAIELREKYTSVKPGYHMDKVHWNTIELDGSIPDKRIYKWIDNSYALVVNGLSKKVRKVLGL